jgi:hypothetical protein
VRSPSPPQEPERFDALERMNFKTDRFPALYQLILGRQGGHYLDVGVGPRKYATG